MKTQTKAMMCITAVLLCCSSAWSQDLLQVRDLFNGKDLSGWVNVNTAPDTWTRQGRRCSSAPAQPIGVMRTDRQYENFILHIEWMHLEAGGNSGVFVWSRRHGARGQAAAQGPRDADAGARLGQSQHNG